MVFLADVGLPSSFGGLAGDTTENDDAAGAAVDAEGVDDVLSGL